MCAHRSSFPPVYPNLNSTPDAIVKGCPKLFAPDVRTIIAVTGNTSTISHICQLAIHNAAEYIRTHNLTLADYDRFVDYLRERPVVVAPPAEATPPHVAGRNPGRGEQIKRIANERTRLGKDVKTGSRGGE